nr:unnamed protein product [Callosobruchus analis]
MKTFCVLLLVIVFNHDISNSLPTDNQCNPTLEISTELQNRCSSLASSDTFTKQLEVLKGCPKWCKLKQVQKLEKGNEKDVLCLLFANSIISFCTTFKNTTLKDVDLIPPSPITVANVCSKLLLPKQNTEFDISSIIPNEKACEMVCSNYYEDSPVVKECAMAYYFANLNTTIITDVKQKPADLPNTVMKTTVDDEKDLADVDHKLASQVQTHLQQDISDVQKKIGSVKAEGGSTAVDQTSVNVNKKMKQQQEEIYPEQKKAPKQVSSGEIVSVGENSKIITKGRVEQKPQEAQAASVPHLDTAPAGSSVAQQAVASIKKDELPVTNPVVPSIKENPEPGEDGKFADIQEHPPILLHDSVAVEANPPLETAGENTEPKIEEEEEGIIPKDEETLPNERLNHLGYSRDDEEENTYDDELGTADAKLVRKKLITSNEPASYNNLEEMDGESYFFQYFMVVLALVLEGKRSKTQYRSRRPNSANYHKLDTNLEEAISSNCNKNSSHVIY